MAQGGTHPLEVYWGLLLPIKGPVYGPQGHSNPAGSHHPTPGLDLDRLVSSILSKVCTPQRTTYATGSKRFNSFCLSYNILTPFSVSQSTLCYYVAYLAKGGLAVNTNPDVIILWAVCTTAFFGVFRLGEFITPSAAASDPTIHLTPADVATDNRAKSLLS